MRSFLHKSLRFILVLIAAYSISKSWLVCRHCHTGYCEKYQIRNSKLILMFFSFSAKGPTTRPALKTKLLFKSFGKSSDKKSVLGSPCCKFLSLRITICTTKGVKGVLLKHSILLVIPRKLFVLESLYSKFVGFFSKVKLILFN